jgi:hypothetical protein
MAVSEALYALVPRGEVDDIVAELRMHVPDDEIEVRDVERGRYPLFDERLHEEAGGLRRGAAAGAAVGALVGLLVTAMLSAPAAATWILFAFGGAAFGALAGGMAGLQRVEPDDDDPARLAVVEDPSRFALLVVSTLHWRFWAHHRMERHPGVRFLDRAAPV